MPNLLRQKDGAICSEVLEKHEIQGNMPVSFLNSSTLMHHLYFIVFCKLCLLHQRLDQSRCKVCQN